MLNTIDVWVTPMASCPRKASGQEDAPSELLVIVHGAGKLAENRRGACL